MPEPAEAEVLPQNIAQPPARMGLKLNLCKPPVIEPWQGKYRQYEQESTGSLRTRGRDRSVLSALHAESDRLIAFHSRTRQINDYKKTYQHLQRHQCGIVRWG